MKRFIFRVKDMTTKEVCVLAKNEEEAREKLIEFDVEREDEIDSDMDLDNAKLFDVEEDLEN